MAWDHATPAEVPLQVTRVQLFPLAAGFLKPGSLPRVSAEWRDQSVATACLLLVVVLLL